MKPNMAAIAEYRKKVQIIMSLLSRVITKLSKYGLRSGALGLALDWIYHNLRLCIMSVKETNLFSFAVQSYLNYLNLENKFRCRMTEQNVLIFISRFWSKK